MLLLWLAILFAMNVIRNTTNEEKDTEKITCNIAEMLQKKDTMRKNYEECVRSVGNVLRRKAKLFVKNVLL